MPSCAFLNGLFEALTSPVTGLRGPGRAGDGNGAGSVRGDRVGGGDGVLNWTLRFANCSADRPDARALPMRCRP